MEPEIKELNVREHYSLIAPMMKELHVSEKSFFDRTAEWAQIETNYMRHVQTMQEECDGCLIAAFDGDTPVGFIFGYLEEQDESRIEEYTGPQLYVSDGYVDPKYRKHGIYRKLNERLEKKFIEKGVRRIIRFTLTNNIPMKGFLASEGYFPTRILFEKWL